VRSSRGHCMIVRPAHPTGSKSLTVWGHQHTSSVRGWSTPKDIPYFTWYVLALRTTAERRGKAATLHEFGATTGRANYDQPFLGLAWRTSVGEKVGIDLVYGYERGEAGSVTTRSTANEQIRTCRRAVSETVATGQATERSCRATPKVLVKGLGGSAVRPVNEPSHIVCGAPDFIVERREVPAGQIEGKHVSTNLDAAWTNEQLKSCGSTDE